MHFNFSVPSSGSIILIPYVEIKPLHPKENGTAHISVYLFKVQ